MSAGNIDILMDLWALNMAKHDDLGPFLSYQQMYATIDNIKQGDAWWKSFRTSYAGGLGPNAPNWQLEDYKVWFRDLDIVIQNMLDNPDFDNQFDYAPYVELDKAGQRRWNEFMSGNFSWRHAVSMAINIYPFTIKSSSKNLLLDWHIWCGRNDRRHNVLSYNSGCGQNHSLGGDWTHWISPSVPFNWECPQHHLACTSKHCCTNWISCYSQEYVNWHRSTIPYNLLGDRKYDSDSLFFRFKRRLYHATLSTILKPLHPGMTDPVICRCPDGHHWRVIYDLAGFIADYPKQVTLAGIVSGWCPRSVLMLLSGCLPSLNSMTGVQHYQLI